MFWNILFSILFTIIIIFLLCLLIATIKNKNTEKLNKEMELKIANLQSVLLQMINTINQNNNENQKNNTELLNQLISNNLEYLKHEEIRSFNELNQNIENMKLYFLDSVNNLTTITNNKLEAMKKTIDNQLETTITNKLNESFKFVQSNLIEVEQSLGEMKNIATSVGDLKKVLSNVKTRGVFGEIQLKAILDEYLLKDQYDENVILKKNGNYVVEFAVKIPSQDSFLYLPIDAKFPLDIYQSLELAYESGSKEQIKKESYEFNNRLKHFAKDIHDKYIDPVITTDFAILYLPAESIFAESLRNNSNLASELQREYHVLIAGPTTLAAILSSLQIGFRTFAIEKRTSDVWKTLSLVKKEFISFADSLEKVQERLHQTDRELDKLVGVKTRNINKVLKEVDTIEYEKEKS